MTIIDVRGLTRSFRAGKRSVAAVRGIDLAVEAGEIVGFLGPNGAGKTTTMRMLTTLLRPDAGTARIAGADLLADPAGVRRRIGYVAQSGGTEQACRVTEELECQAEFYRLGRATGRHRARLLAEQLELGELGPRTIGTLSGGQRRRLDLALGMVHAPAVLFLDEPTTGLDPHSRANLWSHIRGLRAEFGTTIFLTTHYLEEADALSDRILVIDEGRIVAEDTTEALKRRVSADVITVEVGEDASRARAVLEALPRVREVTMPAPRTLRLAVEHGDRAVADVVLALQAIGVAIEAIRVARASLEDVFLQLTRHDAVPAGRN
ncbi:MAG TPA: ATP-binding cassette domain-containing protein [Amycolatopsis sp.]|nr:ATP-binding cassette domain-containing protein [Amycolatopsis sp.]